MSTEARRQQIVDWLRENPGPRTVSEIATGVGADRTTTARVIKRLPPSFVQQTSDAPRRYTLASDLVSADRDELRVPGASGSDA